MTWQRTKGRQLPANWPTIRRAVFQRDRWTCVDCGHHDPTGKTLECDHVGHRDDHRIDACATRCGPCHGKVTAQQGVASRGAGPTRRRPSDPHPGLQR